MLKLFSLIAKNFKFLIRSKTSALVIFLGPLVLVALLGLAYSQSSNFTVSASVYSPKYSALSDSLLDKLSNQTFNVIKENSLESCTSALKSGTSQVCISLPKDMQVIRDHTNEIEFYVDYSQINLVWLILEMMTQKVAEKSAEVTLGLTQDMLDRMDFVDKKILESKKSLDTLTNSGINIKSNLNLVKKGFSGIDLSTNLDTTNINSLQTDFDAIKSSLMNIKAEILSLQNNTKDDLANANNYTTELQNSISETNLSNKISDLDSAIQDIDSAIAFSTGALQTYSSSSISTMNGINSTLIDISSKLSSAQTKISKAAKDKTDLLTKFDTIETDVTKLSTNIATAKNALTQASAKTQALSIKNAKQISSPLTTKINPISTQKSHFNSLFPTLLVLIIMITGILFATTLVIVDKRSKAFFRNNITPTSYLTFTLATYITALIILIIQLILFIGISMLFFKTVLLTSIGYVLLLIFLISSVFIFIGMLVGTLLRTEETGTLGSITLASIFLLFSSAVIPLESLPNQLRNIVAFNPFVISETALKQIIIFNLSITAVLDKIYLLLAYAVGLFVIILIIRKVFRKIAIMHLTDIHLPARRKKNKKHKKDPILPE